MFINIGIAAHIDAGKTTLTERILYYTGVIHKIGEVHDGSATMDYLEEEKERGITITSAVTSLKWKNQNINLIDTPGHVDFTIEVERCMRALDGAIIVLCGVGGVEPQTETVWRQINRYRIPRILFINKLDRIGANFENVLNQIKSKLNIKPVIITYPIGKEDKFQGVIDILKERALYFEGEHGEEIIEKELPEDYHEIVENFKNDLIETAADFDDKIMEKYLEGEPIENRELINAIKKGCYELKIAPVYCGSALKNKGVQPVLDGVINFLPKSDEIIEFRGFDRKTGEKLFFEKPKNTLLAYIFKAQIINNRKICYTRIYSGDLKLGENVFNLTTGERQKISKIYKIHANKRKEIELAKEGDVVGILIKSGNTGDTLTDKKDFPYYLENIEINNPVISFAIEPYSLKELNDLFNALKNIAEEDPSFKYTYNEETNQLIISGMGELHLEIITKRLLREYNLRIKLGKPQVVYRETITKEAEGEYVYDIKIEDENLYGHVGLKVKPLPRTGKDNSNKILFELDLDTIPEKAIEAVKEGINESFISGQLIGAEIIDTEVVINLIEDKTGKYEKGALKVAAINAFKEAYQKAGPIKLEPIMEVTVIVPDECTGEVIGDLNSRGAKVIDVVKEDFSTRIKAYSYLSRLFGYATDLRTLTKGKGEFSMLFYRYDVI